MKSIGSFLILASLLMTLSACVELKDPDKGGNGPAPAAEAEESTVAPTPPPVPVDTRKDLVVEGDMYVYDNDVLNKEDYEEAKKKGPGKQAPFDIVFRSITFSNQGIIYTLGNDVHFIADKIDSTQGHIVTFPPGSKASDNRAGRNGGMISFDIKNAVGSLFVDMRGEDGGNGSSASHLDRGVCQFLDAEAGMSGQNGGSTGSFIFKADDGDSFAIMPNKIFGKGGSAGLTRTASVCAPLFTNNPSQYPTARGKELNPNQLPHAGRDGGVLQICQKLSSSRAMSCD